MKEKILAQLEPFLTPQPGDGGIGSLAFLLVLTLSLLCGMAISLLYRRFYAARETGSQIQRAFPLLSLSITAIFICIQFSLPLSLGLLGALSIVRFRTPIKQPEEIGFLMVVIATSLACATFNFGFLGIILLLAAVALVLQEVAPGLLRGGPGGGIVMVALPESAYEKGSGDLLAALSEGAPKGRIDSISRNGDQVVVSYGFRGLSPQAATALEGRLAGLAADAQVTIAYERS